MPNPADGHLVGGVRHGRLFTDMAH